MKTAEDLRRSLSAIDHKSYGMYKTLAGQYAFGNYTLCIDHVQGDPFAAPSKLRIVVEQAAARFPACLFDERHKRIALQDHLTRLFYANIGRLSQRVGGSGGSGRISISRCGQQVLERTAMYMDTKQVEARFEVGFPAAGRTILARELEKIVFGTLPKLAEQTLLYPNIDQKAAQRAVELAEDQFALRRELRAQGWVAFVADGSVLPRESGVSDKPMRGAVAFRSPDTMAAEVELPHRGRVRGMAIRRGVTLIVGGGYHGKSTLLHALERGVYDHIAGDGREYIATDHSAVKIRAEDGRSIKETDISLFINNLPNGKDTARFSSENASGSTSQAANVVEALEAGAQTLLIDEDTSATNFMIRDGLMQQLIGKDKEPITPFIDMVRPMYEQMGISSVLVVGSSGTYFGVADAVIQMDSYLPYDVTEQAGAICGAAGEHTSAKEGVAVRFDRVPHNGYMGRDERGPKLRSRGLDTLAINKEDIDVRCLEQLVDPEQVAALGHILRYMDGRLIDGRRPLREAVEEMDKLLETRGILCVVTGGYCPDFLARPRKQELLACLGRYRSLRFGR